MKLIRNGNEFALKHGSETILEYRKDLPIIYVGCGKENVDMYRGNFKIEDYVTERRALYVTGTRETPDGLVFDMEGELSMTLKLDGGCAALSFEQKNPAVNRFWFRVSADADEKCYGCGEQMSYFNLRGRHFPLWTSEPGVGRDKTTYVTWRSDVENKAGGDYYNTNYPQPTFVSTKHYYLHVDSTAYADFDFRSPGFHELQIWEVPSSIRIEAAENFVELLEKESAFFGRQPELPDWIYNGLIIGVQGGNERSFGLLEKTLEHGIKVSGIWCQDWCGKRVTSFGKRLQWDWQYHKEMYPGLPEQIKELHERGIRFLGYINPYLVNDGDLYRRGKEAGVFATKADGSDYLVDFGEFYCGVVDFTNPAAYEWFKNEVIIKHSLDIGVDGWMADFGEYLPTGDIVLASGKTAMVEHNRWPALWAKCNYDALVETGKLGEAVYFMRAGGTGSQKYCTLLWAGDQSVDFTIHDGLATVICAALSAGMTGCGLSHSDIGGYTSLFGNTRTKELFLRWAEMAAFTPVMRTHEGNRPDENFQYYEDEDCMNRLARLVDIYTMMAPYIKMLVAENAKTGIPVQRPLFLHNEEDEACYDIQYEYMLGRDVLAAPVYLAERIQWEVYLPKGEWIHLWTGDEYGKGSHTVPATLGDTPVFCRKDSEYAPLFEEIRRKHGK
ncbi:alpha-glucosidase [uncultured Clostridium sp.]|uniref:alpha-glucosidase n=1 Tax=uncultured Clostridium sp. TaxID=59620 RepID=UPI0025D1B2E4|nr:alpha-glucosidase [uncultured Clostridium sp.]